MLSCHPKIKTKKCINKNIKNKLKARWNRMSTKKIRRNNDIMKELRNILKCSNDYCVLNKIDKELLDNNFAPKAPYYWNSNVRSGMNALSSLDIINVMKQYEEKYKTFKFIGPSPIDYNFDKNGRCVCNNLCNYTKDKRKVGIIFNLDPHYLKGSHWVCLYIDNSKKIIVYFDSLGNKINSNIKSFVDDNLQDYEYIDNYNYILTIGNTSECGMYCLHIIITLLTNRKINNNKDIKRFIRKRISDDKIHKYRYKYFN